MRSANNALRSHVIVENSFLYAVMIQLSVCPIRRQNMQNLTIQKDGVQISISSEMLLTQFSSDEWVKHASAVFKGSHVLSRRVII